MKLQATIAAIAILAIFPLVSNAQGFNNINVNLNDVMVSQRMQEMSQRLNDAQELAPAPKKHKKHEKKAKNHRMALLQNADVQQADTVQAPAPATN